MVRLPHVADRAAFDVASCDPVAIGPRRREDLHDADRAAQYAGRDHADAEGTKGRKRLAALRDAGGGLGGERGGGEHGRTGKCQRPRQVGPKRRCERGEQQQDQRGLQRCEHVELMWPAALG